MGTLYETALKGLKFTKLELIRSILDAYTKPAYALLALGWAYLATSELNQKFYWEMFYIYLLCQVVWLLFGWSQLEKISNREANPVLLQIAVVAALYLLASLFVFSYVNAWLFLASILEIFMTYPEAKGFSSFIIILAVVALIVIWYLRKKQRKSWLEDMEDRFP